MNKRILFVDDDPHVLSSYKRTFNLLFQVTTAEGPAVALDILRSVTAKTPFAVIVSDFKMPVMNGLAFLKEARAISPLSVRVMLTGFAEIDTAMMAINEGAIFRFLAKPCSPEILRQAIEACLEQYHLVNSEKELLRGTLQGAIKVTTSLLALASPEAFGMSDRIRRIVAALLVQMPVQNGWVIEIAAMLSQIGCLAVPQATMQKFDRGEKLTKEEEKQFAGHPATGAKLLTNIPRLEDVAEIIRLQDLPDDEIAPFGSRMIHLAIRYDRLVRQGVAAALIMAEISELKIIYGEQLIAALSKVVSAGSGGALNALSLDDLREGMIVDEDIFTVDHLLLISKGQELTEASITRLRNYGVHCGVKEPINVIIPEKRRET